MTINWEKDKEPYKVGDKWRINPLSHQPGGVKVFVKFNSGFIKVYDKVKHPNQFISKIHESNNPDISNIWWENK
jgi:hypothetical protein